MSTIPPINPQDESPGTQPRADIVEGYTRRRKVKDRSPGGPAARSNQHVRQMRRAVQATPDPTLAPPSDSPILSVIPDSPLAPFDWQESAARTLALTRTRGPDQSTAESHATPFGLLVDFLSERDPHTGQSQFNGKLRFLTYLRSMLATSDPDSPSDPKLERVLAAWDKLSPQERQWVAIEDLCMVGGIDPATLFGRVCEHLARLGVNISGAMAWASAPHVMSRVIEEAKRPGPDGFSDRKMLFQHYGFLPQPKGATVINGNQINATATQGGVVNAGIRVGGASDFEQLMLEADRESQPLANLPSQPRDVYVDAEGAEESDGEDTDPEQEPMDFGTPNSIPTEETPNAR